jgi:hypothetical protein
MKILHSQSAVITDISPEALARVLAVPNNAMGYEANQDPSRGGCSLAPSPSCGQHCRLEGCSRGGDDSILKTTRRAFGMLRTGGKAAPRELNDVV